MDPPISSLFNRCHKANLPKWSECKVVDSNKIEHRRLMSNLTNILWGHWFKRSGEIRGTVTQWAALFTICVSVVILYRNTKLCAPSFHGAEMALVSAGSGEWKQCLWSCSVQSLHCNVKSVMWAVNNWQVSPSTGIVRLSQKNGGKRELPLSRRDIVSARGNPDAVRLPGMTSCSIPSI